MSGLPELTDEQIDTAWKRANTTPLTEHGPVLNRGLPSWRELRAAFPKPKPPAPIFERDDYSVLPMRSSEWPVSVTADGVALTVHEAREFATAINACADWIEASS